MLDLTELLEGWRRYAAHPPHLRKDAGKEYLQAPLENLVAAACASLPEVRVGTGKRPNPKQSGMNELDIVVDLDGDEWFIKTRGNVDQRPVLAHLEVTAEIDQAKLRKDMKRLQRTIDEAQSVNVKTWTAIVSLGEPAACEPQDYLSFAHDFYHGRELVPWEDVPVFDYARSYIDAIVFPGGMLKKHDLIEEIIRGYPKTQPRDRVPAYFLFPLSPSDAFASVRPVVVALAYLRSFLRKVLRKEPVRAPAWNDDETTSVVGPDLSSQEAKAWRARPTITTLRHVDASVLLHATGPQSPPQQMVADNDSRCDARQRFLYSGSRVQPFERSTDLTDMF